MNTVRIHAVAAVLAVVTTLGITAGTASLAQREVLASAVRDGTPLAATQTVVVVGHRMA